MSIEYRTVDVDATEANVLKQRAVEAEKAAYVQEVEALRLEALVDVATKKEDKDALKKQAAETREALKPERNRAKRLNKDGVASAEELAEARRSFLEQWIPQIEGEHVQHTALLKQREASLADTSEFGPNDADRERIEKNIEENKTALKVLESTWKVATKELDSL